MTWLTIAVLIRGLSLMDPLIPAPDLPGPGEPCLRLWVTDHGWHTGLVIPTAAIPPGRLPAVGALRTHTYVEIGWGDATFYQAAGKTLGNAAWALFVPTPAALHVVGFSAEPAAAFPWSQVKALPVRPERLEALLTRLEQDTLLDAAGAPLLLSQSLYGDDGHFVRASGAYVWHYTCNTWLADRLKLVGLPVASRFRLTASSVFDQLPSDLGAVCPAPQPSPSDPPALPASR